MTNTWSWSLHLNIGEFLFLMKLLTKKIWKKKKKAGWWSGQDTWPNRSVSMKSTCIFVSSCSFPCASHQLRKYWFNLRLAFWFNWLVPSEMNLNAVEGTLQGLFPAGCTRLGPSILPQHFSPSSAPVYFCMLIISCCRNPAALIIWIHFKRKSTEKYNNWRISSDLWQNAM